MPGKQIHPPGSAGGTRAEQDDALARRILSPIKSIIACFEPRGILKPLSPVASRCVLPSLVDGPRKMGSFADQLLHR